MDGPPEGENFLSPQEWTNHPKRMKVLKVPEVDGPPEGEIFFKSTRVDESPKKGEGSLSPLSGRIPSG